MGVSNPALPGGPSAAARFLAKLDENLSDASIVVAGDSTGDATTEWVYLMAQTLASRYPTHTVTYRAWNGSTAYGAPTTIQTGTGARTLHVYNGSAAGTNADRYMGSAFEAHVVAPNPDLVFVSHGHNELSGHPSKRFRVRLMALCETVLSALPFAGIVLVGQNPQSGNDLMAPLVEEARNYAALRGFGFVDVHRAFKERGDFSPLMADAVHPNAAGEAAWHDETVKLFRYDRGAPLPAQGVSSLAEPAQNLLANGDFSQFATGAFTGWTGTNVTQAVDTTNFETGTQAARLTSATGAQAYLAQNVSRFRELRGQWATLAVRMRIASGQPNATGQMHLIDNASLELSREPAARDGFFWAVLHKRVDPAATSLSVRIYANVSTPVSELVADRAVLCRGVLPRDAF